jgi:hypothetical protein
MKEITNEPILTKSAKMASTKSKTLTLRGAPGTGAGFSALAGLPPLAGTAGAVGAAAGAAAVGAAA